MITDEYAGLGRSRGQQGLVDRVVDNLDGKRRGQFCLDPFGRVRGDPAEKKRLHDVTMELARK